MKQVQYFAVVPDGQGRWQQILVTRWPEKALAEREQHARTGIIYRNWKALETDLSFMNSQPCWQKKGAA